MPLHAALLFHSSTMHTIGLNWHFNRCKLTAELTHFTQQHWIRDEFELRPIAFCMLLVFFSTLFFRSFFLGTVFLHTIYRADSIPSFLFIFRIKTERVTKYNVKPMRNSMKRAKNRRSVELKETLKLSL